MAGLVETTTTEGSPESGAGAGATTLDMSGVSHMDSLFQTSGWTREDLELLAAVLNLVLVALLVYAEVSR